MPEQIQARQSRQREAVAERTETTPDLRDEQLSEDVECCLAEIDAVLAETASEREKAIAEFRDIKNRRPAEDTARDERLWQARYAHLGLRLGATCCGLHINDSQTGEIIR